MGISLSKVFARMVIEFESLYPHKRLGKLSKAFSKKEVSVIRAHSQGTTFEPLKQKKMKVKFKAWDRELKKMISWDDIEKENLHHIIKDNRYEILLCKTNIYNKDKEVYDGDIIEFKYVSQDFYHSFDFGVVQFLEGRFSIKTLKYGFSIQCIESQFDVIGNIFEQTYLLSEIKNYYYTKDYPNSSITSPIYIFRDFNFNKNEMDYFIEKSEHIPRKLLKEVIVRPDRTNRENEKKLIGIVKKNRLEKLDMKNKKYYKIYLEVKNNIEQYKNYV